MPRFVARPIAVEAHQFVTSTAIWPETFRRAVRRHLPDGTLEIATGDGARQCKHGDWVIGGPDGDFVVMSAARFETMFGEAAPPVVESPDLLNGRRPGAARAWA